MELPFREQTRTGQGRESAPLLSSSHENKDWNEKFPRNAFTAAFCGRAHTTAVILRPHVAHGGAVVPLSDRLLVGQYVLKS